MAFEQKVGDTRGQARLFCLHEWMDADFRCKTPCGKGSGGGGDSIHLRHSCRLSALIVLIIPWMVSSCTVIFYSTLKLSFIALRND